MMGHGPCSSRKTLWAEGNAHLSECFSRFRTYVLSLGICSRRTVSVIQDGLVLKDTTLRP